MRRLLDCMHGPDIPVPGDCGATSLDVDQDIDLHDYAILQTPCVTP